MNEVKIKIKLPKDLTVHIPTFSDIDLESVLPVIGVYGKKLIYETITDRVLEEFKNKHEKLIGKIVKRLMEEKEQELKEVLNIK